jgi:hypothetical protein
VRGTGCFVIGLNQAKDANRKDQLPQCNHVIILKWACHTRCDRRRVVKRPIRAVEINQVKMIGCGTQQRVSPRNTKRLGIEGAQVNVYAAAAAQQRVADNIQPELGRLSTHFHAAQCASDAGSQPRLSEPDHQARRDTDYSGGSLLARHPSPS